MRARYLMLFAVIVALTACRGENATVTGSYGSGMLAGSVVMSEGEGSPEGVELSVRGTGMTTTLGADGRFVFAGVPENAVLDFRRADGIDASLDVNGGKGSVHVELGRGGARRSGRGNSRRDKREFEGVIRTASAEEIVVFTSHRQEVTIALTADTVIRKGNQILTAADLEAGLHVHVRARTIDDVLTALLVIVQEGDDGEGDPPALRQYEGVVSSASASELIIDDSHGNEVTLALTAETVIRKGGTNLTAADLLPGVRVHVKAEVAADGSATAVEVIVQNTKGPKGPK